MKKIKLMTLGVLFFIGEESALAAISLDRTRVVYEGGNKAISLNISNENKKLPYLAQAWIEDGQQKKTTGPLLVTPPVQRVESGAKSMVRISALSEASGLPQDRESLFYFNLREIPPRSDKPNVMQIALQTKIKLFYRPATLVVKPGTVWQDQLILHKTDQGYRLENPTAYYITVVGIAARVKGETQQEFQPVMVAPKSSSDARSPAFSNPLLTYVNDYGGRPEIQFTCKKEICRAATGAAQG